MPVTQYRSSDDHNIDKGWAWVVAFACMFCNFFMNGFVKTFGIFFVEFLDLFQGSSSATSIIYGTQLAAFSGSGLLVLAILTELVNCRTLVMIGGVAFSLSITASSFAQTLAEAVIFIGLFGGIGQALMYGPNIVMLGKYFDKRRALAIGIAGCGGSLGQLVLPPLIRLLIDFYSFRGALLIFGGLVLNCTLCGSMLRPLTGIRRSILQNKDEDNREVNTGSRTSDTFDVLVGDERLDSNLSVENEVNRSLDGFNANMNLTLKSLPNIHLLSNNAFENRQPSNSSLPFLNQLTTRRYHRYTEMQGPLCDELLEAKYRQLVQSQHDNKMAEHSFNTASLRYPINGDIQSSSIYNLHTQKRAQQEQLTEENSNDKNECCLRSKFPNCSGKQILKCDILKDVLFLLVLVTAVLAYVGCATEVVFIPPHAKDNGITDDEITVLVSVMGGCDLVCRLLIGLVADMGWVERYKILMIGLFILGISAHLASLAHLFWHFLAISLIYGICGGALPALMAVVLVDFFGVELLSRSLGLVFLFQGVGISVFNPLFGWLRDTTGSYRATFHAIGACLIIAGAALLAVPIFRRWRTKRIKSRDISNDDRMLPATVEIMKN